MGWIKDQWNAWQGREHTKLLARCRAKSAGLITVMEMANALFPNREITNSLFDLKNLSIDFTRMGATLSVMGKLSLNDAERLIGLLKQLTAMERAFAKGARTGKAT